MKLMTALRADWQQSVTTEEIEFNLITGISVLFNALYYIFYACSLVSLTLSVMEVRQCAFLPFESAFLKVFCYELWELFFIPSEHV